MPTECAECGCSLSGAEYVAPWEDDDNEYGYYICPNCGYENEFYDD
ncbi:MAG: hypothetical protein IJN99_03425 [Clostridia bacterium]|nr:hypothetical protein [Clostridia bacterium]